MDLARRDGVDGRAAAPVVNTASISGMHQSPAMGMYNATKAARSRHQAAGAGLSPRIRVNAVRVVRTRLAGAVEGPRGSVGGDHCARTIRGAGRHSERSRVPGFGCRSWITGETMIIDGGLLSATRAGIQRTQH